MRLLSIVGWERDLQKLTWTSWTPTVTAGAGSFVSTTINSARYLKLGRIVFYEIDVSCTDAGTASADVRFSTPSGLPPANAGQCGAGRELNATGNMLQALSLNTGIIICWTYDNTFPLTSGRRVLVGGFYQI